MENLFDKIKEYVNMDTEISAVEFQEYYKQVMDKLATDFEQLTQDGLLQAKVITSIMSANAAGRSKKKTADTKRFKKISEKSRFWSGAITYRLKKSGLSDKEIEQRAGVWEKTLSEERASPLSDQRLAD